MGAPVVFGVRRCGVYKNTPHSSLLDALHPELFEQPELAYGFFNMQ